MEVRAAIREAGIASLDDVEAVLLEADSGFSVVKRSEDTQATALSDVVTHGAERISTPPPQSRGSATA